MKSFTFNASSFSLDSTVEKFLKSRGAITLDFGTSAYVNSEIMPTILSELVEKINAGESSSTYLVAQLKAEVDRYSAERKKIIEENIRHALQIKSSSVELNALKEKMAETTRLVETLKAENGRLQVALKAAPIASTQPSLPDDKIRQSYEKLLKDVQALRMQNAEALASLKVLEDENDELMLELEKLMNQSKTPAASKAF